MWWWPLANAVTIFTGGYVGIRMAGRHIRRLDQAQHEAHMRDFDRRIEALRDLGHGKIPLHTVN